jgi:hypothetical protein
MMPSVKGAISSNFFARQLITAGLFVCAHAYAEVTTGTDEQAQLPYWQWQDDVVSIRFVQRLPDQTRAYFAGRGFIDADVKYIAGHCIFQTVFRNIAAPKSNTSLEYDMSNWRVQVQGQQIELKRREAWQPIWVERKVSSAQQIAFEWSLLPTKQRYLPSDYNWGMSVFPVPHGTTFDLQLSWRINDKPATVKINGMQCPKDIYIPPQGE